MIFEQGLLIWLTWENKELFVTLNVFKLVESKLSYKYKYVYAYVCMYFYCYFYRESNGHLYYSKIN